MVGALLDSRADERLIDVTLARQAGIPLEPMDTTLSAQALDGHLLGKISHRTDPVIAHHFRESRREHPVLRVTCPHCTPGSGQTIA